MESRHMSAVGFGIDRKSMSPLHGQLLFRVLYSDNSEAYTSFMGNESVQLRQIVDHKTGNAEQRLYNYLRECHRPFLASAQIGAPYVDEVRELVKRLKWFLSLNDPWIDSATEYQEEQISHEET